VRCNPSSYSELDRGKRRTRIDETSPGRGEAGLRVTLAGDLHGREEGGADALGWFDANLPLTGLGRRSFVVLQ
jgi:hypothetical protein